MRLVSRLLWVLAVFPIGGCNEVTAPTTAPLDLTIQDGERALEGVQLCQTDTRNCDLSDADGHVTIDLPIGQETSYTYEREGYDSRLIPYVMPESGVSMFWIMTEDVFLADLYEGVDSPYPRIDRGEIYILLNPPIAGATFTLRGAATSKAYYQVGTASGNDATLRLDLTATTSDGRGGFLEVPPGTSFRVEFGGTAKDCVPSGSGWPGDVENSVRTPVREDYTSFLIVRCSPSL